MERSDDLIKHIHHINRQGGLKSSHDVLAGADPRLEKEVC